MMHNEQNILRWMQSWYQQYCDGDWEHAEHFHIRNIDNPGWRVSISLAGTHCEGKKFKNVEVELSELNWYHCFLRDNKFEGASGPTNLIDILNIFKNWAESCQKEDE